MPAIPAKDALTGLLSRRGLASRLKDQASGGALLFLDVDALAYANHTLGPPAVDLLLVRWALELKDCLPPHGFIGRLSSDEFLAYVPDGATAAADVAEQMRSRTERTWASARRRVHVEAGDWLRPLPENLLTVSVGIAHWNASFAAAVRAAETACHEAKRTGRNRTVIAD